MRAEPVTYLWYSVQKIAYYWMGHPSADWAGLRYMEGTERAQYLTTFLWAPVCFLSAIAVRFWRRMDEFLPYLLLATYFTAVHAVFWAELRLSLPMQPLLTVFMAVAIVERVGQPLAARMRASRPAAP